MQNFLGFFTRPIPRHVMLGSGFHGFLHELDKTQWCKPEILKKNQECKLRALIKHAYHRVPYYHRIFKKRNIRPEDIETIEDLGKLPILTKEDIRNHFNELIAVNAKDYKYGIGRTSGSTGKPLTFYLDQQNREIEYATLWRQLNWGGIGVDDKIATFRGGLVYEFGKTNALWKFNALSKELEFNTFNMNESVLRNFVEKVKSFSPDLIKGYLSVLETVAEFMLNNDIAITPKAIQTSSETLFEGQREIVEEAFDCKIYDWYSHSEYVVSAGQCSEGNYHISEAGIMEFLKNGDNVAPGELGEIVGTRLYNYSMPFIRYKTEDIGKFSNEECVCGRGLPLLQSLEGRISDLVTTPDGRIISATCFEHFWEYRISPYTPNVDYVKFIQKSKKKLVVEMVKGKYYTDEETQTILRELKVLLGSEIEIEFKDLNSIPIGRKRRFTESEINVSLI